MYHSQPEKKKKKKKGKSFALLDMEKSTRSSADIGFCLYSSTVPDVLHVFTSTSFFIITVQWRVTYSSPPPLRVNFPFHRGMNSSLMLCLFILISCSDLVRLRH